jgi:hypothetical protein
VTFLASNNYTGSTTVDGRLVVEAPLGIGNGAAAGPIQVNGTLRLAGGGSLGPTGPIEVNGDLIFSTADNPAPEIPLDTQITLRNRIVVDGTARPSDVQASIGSVAIPAGLVTFDIDTTNRNARLNIASLSRSPASALFLDWADFGQTARDITIGNGPALVVNGIIPWANFGTPSAGFSLVTYGPTGLERYSGPFVSDINSAGPTDNVNVDVAQNAAMTGNVSVNSIQGFVNTQGHTLNVGATPVNGVATGRVFATIAGDSGFLTAGQSAFAPNSAHPGELILNANVAASIIDNAGPDGIFNNDDDLPVSVVLLTGNLTNPNNRYTGGTTVLGRVRTQHPLPGPQRCEMERSTCKPRRQARL